MIIEEKSLLSQLNNIRIILVETSHPGNIGAAARAMKTMGLKNLYLVKPKRFPDDNAIMMAAGADDILNNAQVTQTLDEAIANVHSIYGTSARDRSLTWPIVSPGDAAIKISAEAEYCQTAIVFGRESTGLTNAELQRCHYHLQIPSCNEYSSLNLAAAVQIICYELRVAALAQKTIIQKSINSDIEDLAPQEAVENFYQQLDKVLKYIDFIKPNTPNQIMARLRRLFNRTRLETVEINILRGILTEIMHMQNKRKE